MLPDGWPFGPRAWRALPARVQAWILGLIADLARLREEAAEWRARATQDSSNSSKPPSTDLHRAGRQRRPPSGRRAGGQPGHKGRTRGLLPADRVDQTENLFPAACRRCGRLLQGVEPEADPWRHQVTELLELRVQVTEYRCHRVRCPDCGTATTAKLPEGVAQGGFGPRACAAVALLVGRFRLSRREVVECCREILGFSISVGAVVRICGTVKQALGGPVKALVRRVRRSRLVYMDDTSWWEKGKRKALWVVDTTKDVLFHIASGRTQEALRGLLGKKFRGFGVGDRAGANGVIPPHRRGVCWGHLIRNFKGRVERGGPGAWLGKWGVDLAGRLFGHWQAYKKGEISWKRLRKRMARVQGEMNELLEHGREHVHAGTRRFWGGLWKLRDALFLFTRVEGVEPTSNLPERDLRPGVLWRHVSQGTRGEGGSEFVAGMLSMTTSCRRRGIPLLAYLTDVCRAWGEARPVPCWWKWRARDGSLVPRSGRRRGSG